MISQTQRILSALEAGESLTALQAFRRFGTLALHSRVAELRGRGYRVLCSMVSHKGKRFGKYRLA